MLSAMDDQPKAESDKRRSTPEWRAWLMAMEEPIDREELEAARAAYFKAKEALDA